MALPVRSMTLTEAVDTTRSGSAWYFDENGVFQEESTSDTARIDYDPATGNRLGLMAEGASTNLLTYSEDLSNAAWSKGGVTIGTPTTFATNISLDELVEDSSTSAHSVVISSSVASGATATASVFLKAGARTEGLLRVYGTSASDNYRVPFDLSSGTVGTAAISGNGSVGSASITDVGGGVYRLNLTGSISGIGVRNVQLFLDDGTGTSYTGDGSSSLYGGGFQLEELPGASSYIPTTGSQVTRAAETHELVSLDPWYRASGYSVAVQWQHAFLSGNQSIIHFNDGTTNNLSSIYTQDSPARARFSAVSGGSVVLNSDVSSTTLSPYTVHKVAARYSADNFAASLDGEAAATDNAGAMPASATELRLMSGSATGAGRHYGWIQDLKYTTALWSDAELATESGTTV